MQGGTDVNAHALTLLKEHHPMRGPPQAIRTALATFFPSATVTVRVAETGRRFEACLTSVRPSGLRTSVMLLALPAASL